MLYDSRLNDAPTPHVSDLLLAERVERKVDGAGRAVPQFFNDLVFADLVHKLKIFERRAF